MSHVRLPLGTVVLHLIMRIRTSLHTIGEAAAMPEAECMAPLGVFRAVDSSGATVRE